ncbi:MAG: hypothetical protein JWL80_600 [Parcubacteria group bacterium]|nr:hypothetical protein [Parcubacteria group bacterium]
MHPNKKGDVLLGKLAELLIVTFKGVPESEAETVKMFYGFYDGIRYSTEEIAKMSGLKPRTVKKHIRSMLIRLRENERRYYSQGQLVFDLNRLFES